MKQSNWTPEACEYLDGYLAQVRALVRQSGEEADETAAELREHIEREAEAAGGSIVTLEQLRAVIGTVGSPEQVAGADSLIGRTAAAGDGERHSPSAPVATAMQGMEPATATPPRRAGCWYAVVALGVFATVVVLAICALVAFQWSNLKKATINAQQKEIVITLRTIHKCEQRELEKPENDMDGDGVPDYVSLQALVDTGFLSEAYDQAAHGNYVFNLKTTPSASNGGRPSFVCEATPIIDELPNRYTIDESGEVRTLPRGVEAEGPAMYPL